MLRSTGIVENPNQQLLQDLPILEDLDKYQLVEDIEFLRDFSRLPDMSGAAESSDRGANVAKRQQRSEETIEERRLRVEQMVGSGQQTIRLASRNDEQSFLLALRLQGGFGLAQFGFQLIHGRPQVAFAGPGIAEHA